MSTIKVGDCRSCGQELIQVVGEETYHPWNAEWPDFPDKRCPALIPIAGTEEWREVSYSRRVPDDEFVNERETIETDEPV